MLIRKSLFYSVAEASKFIGANEFSPSGCSVKIWNKWEAGTVRVPLDISEKIVKVLGWRNELYNEIITTNAKAVFDVDYESLYSRSNGALEEYYFSPYQSAVAMAVSVSGIELIN